MTRSLIIETASPKRVREKAEQLLKSGTYPDPEVLIGCNERNRHKYEEVVGIKVHALAAPSRHSAIKELTGNRFDIAFAFWTGERQYRRWKLLGFRLKAKKNCIISGDGPRPGWTILCSQYLTFVRLFISLRFFNMKQTTNPHYQK